MYHDNIIYSKSAFEPCDNYLYPKNGSRPVFILKGKKSLKAPQPKKATHWLGLKRLMTQTLSVKATRIKTRVPH